MKPHPRIRKTIKWGGAAVTVLLLVVWVASVWFAVDYYSVGGTMVRVGSGRMHMASRPGLVPIGGKSFWSVGYAPEPLKWMPDWETNPAGWSIDMPLGISIGISALLTMLARRTPRIPSNLCPKCGYDRTGLAPSAVCPECGTAPVQP